MNPTQSNTLLGGKINTSASHSPVQQQQPHIPSPNFDSGSRRVAGHSNAPLSAARSSQGLRKQHKNQRRPRLVDEDVMAESGAIRKPSNRRGQTSITHLLNFAPLPHPQSFYSTPNRAPRRNITYGLGSGHHASDKARYIHANYRFIVNPSGNYRTQAVDADVHLEWNNVLQILASSVSQTSACPICLSHPVAPRMAKCGHIFCLPCLIRYMHSTEETTTIPEKRSRWKKCPICWDSVYLSDTRPVRWYAGQENPAPCDGDDVVLRLVMRQPGSTLALPRDGADALGKTEDIPWFMAAEVTDYARVMKGSEDYMHEQYDAEIEALQIQEKEDELHFGEDTEWTKKAVRAIREAQEKIQGIGNPPNLAAPQDKAKRPAIQFNNTNEGVPEMYLHQTSVNSGLDASLGSASPVVLPVPNETDRQQKPATSNFPKRSANPTAAHHPDTPWFFYQALLHYYLAPLDIRILKAAFGEFSAFPSTLLPRVERVSTGHIVDDQLRKRLKYLGHLPYGCEVGFLECNWTDVVVPEVLEKFTVEIERRRKANRDKDNREEKDRLRAEKEEDDKRWSSARRKRIILPEPDFIGNDAPSLAASSFGTGSPPWGARQGSSFASLASPSTSPSGPKTVWGTTQIVSPSPDLTPQQPQEHDDGWLQDWEKELLAENVLIAQVQAGESSSAGEAQAVFGGGKKKKGKKITLMSTTARRAA